LCEKEVVLTLFELRFNTDTRQVDPLIFLCVWHGCLAGKTRGALCWCTCW